MAFETAFIMETSSVKYGAGATREVGWDVKRAGGTRVMVVTDPYLSESRPVQVALKSLRDEGLDAVLYDRVRVEPTDVSFKEAIDFRHRRRVRRLRRRRRRLRHGHRQGRQPLRHAGRPTSWPT